MDICIGRGCGRRLDEPQDRRRHVDEAEPGARILRDEFQSLHETLVKNLD